MCTKVDRFIFTGFTLHLCCAKLIEQVNNDNLYKNKSISVLVCIIERTLYPFIITNQQLEIVFIDIVYS